MAHYDTIGESGLDQLLTRRLTTPGGAVAPNVAPELFPGITLENDRPEWGALKGERLCARFCFLAAVAAQYGMFQLYLPTTARSIVVLTSVVSNTTQVINVARLVGISGGLGGWTAVTTGNRDTSANGNGSSAILESNSNVAQPTAFAIMAQMQNAGQRFEEPIVIRPGGSIGIYQNVVNVNSSFNISWYERAAQPGEL